MTTQSFTVWPGRPYPLGATFDGGGVNFALFSAHAERGRTLPVLVEGPGNRPHRSARAHRRGLARLSARPHAGSTLRLPRPRTLRARTGPPLQSGQAAARSLCAPDHQGTSLVGRALRLPYRQRPPRSFPGPPGQRLRHAERRRGRSHLYLGRRPTARHALVRDGDLRGPCQRPHHAASGHPGRGARPVHQPDRATGPRSPDQARRHGDRASCRCTPSSTSPTCSITASSNYWGYNSIGFFAPEPRYLGPGGIRDFPGHGASPARRRHRGHPGRGLQSHRRGQRARPDLLISRHRQCQLLPPASTAIRATTPTTPAAATP